MKSQSFSPSLRPSARLHHCLPLFLVATLWAASPAPAATRTWTGAYFSGYWSAAANWDSGAPVAGDDLVFPAGAADLVNTNNLGSTFNSITISGSGYVLRGNAVGLTSGLTATYASGSSTVELDINLGASESFECLYSTATIYISGDIDLGSYTLTTIGAGSVRFGGVISGTGGLTKSGSGTHWLYGASANSYSGDTLVNSATLMLVGDRLDVKVSVWPIHKTVEWIRPAKAGELPEKGRD